MVTAAWQQQARGAFVDARSDIDSAEIILCELLTGKVPFNGSPIAVVSAQIEHQPPTLQQLARRAYASIWRSSGSTSAPWPRTRPG